MINRRSLIAGIALSPLIGSGLVYAQRSSDGAVFIRRGLAIGGTDPVAYFTKMRPVAGKRKYEHVWNGARWRFSSAGNLAKFQADPEAYAPQYGGFCAYGVAGDYKVKTEPEAWTIHNGKLYLNYSLSVRRTWLKDTDNYIRQANANWPALMHK